MNSNPYAPPNDVGKNSPRSLSFNWARFLYLNFLFALFLFAAPYVIGRWKYLEQQQQLPRRYASYDPEFEINIYPMILGFLIIMLVPNVFAYFGGFYTKRNTANAR